MTIVNEATSGSITLESSIMLVESSFTLLDSNVPLENIYSAGITHNDHHW
jgi:hypothetical protein